jgi:DNA-directed RNA polymerase specialized sigma24 family protein
MSTGTHTLAQSPSGSGPAAFNQLLHWLDDGTDSHGERYLEMRRRLAAYFDRRNRPAPDLLVDETFDRIARTLATSGHIGVTPPARYCYVVARFVLLEDIRAGRRTVALDERRLTARPPALPGGDGDPRHPPLACLERCLARLTPADRALIVDYYRDAKRARIDRRRSLAERLGITMNALGIRAWRLRATLEACVRGSGKDA